MSQTEVILISSCQKVQTSDPYAYAWAGLRKSQNIEFVARKLIEMHQVPARWHSDVKKQAEQLRHCLIQAREYFAAAKAVSLATKPNLLYYGLMSLALAEILFKQTGDSSLDRARSEHRHHGLTFTVGGVPKNADLAEASTFLRAAPMEMRVKGKSKGKGTFHLWHSSSREPPLSGFTAFHFPDTSGNTSHYGLILDADPRPFPQVTNSGLTLKDCLAALPFMLPYCDSVGLTTPFVRGKVTRTLWLGEQWRRQTDIYLHPNKLNAALVESIKVDPNRWFQIDMMQVDTGYHIRIQEDWINGRFGFPLPPATMTGTEEWRLWTNTPSLNEFGYFYVGLFMAGSYARYYPDLWLKDIEQATPLALAIEELCSLAEWRVPWLSLCELDRKLYVIDS